MSNFSSSNSFSYTGFQESDSGYSEDFDEDLKEEVRELAGYCCENCGISSLECRNRFGSGLHVHHVNMDKSDNRVSNLKALCPKCHAGVHGQGLII